MRLIFSYSLEKDIQNFKIASKSINNKTPTKMQTAYIERFGPVFEDYALAQFITEYLEATHLDLAREVERIERQWRSIEDAFLTRSRALFGLSDSDATIRVYLTTDGRCSYNLEEKYFFVSVVRDHQNKTIMHELLHFWTWEVFRGEVTSGRVNQKVYNDVKESLTELLNQEFVDLLEGVRDEGYPQHKEIRSVVAKTWQATRSLRKVFAAALAVIQ